MSSFLTDLAQTLHNDHPDLDRLTVVFPNRRAVLYFRKYLAMLLEKPAFSPRLITIEDFFNDLSPLRIADRLVLVKKLHEAYTAVAHLDEPFDKFYFWGEMLLHDFDEADKYLIDVAMLFKDLSNQKELESVFEFFTEEQLTFLRNFWENFDEHASANKKRFLSVWRSLKDVYEGFTKSLLEEDLAYDGLLHRRVAESIEESGYKANRSIIFAGFNALTAAEEKVIGYFVKEHGAKVYWDADTYYINNHNQEAGRFLRDYQQHPVLGQTFPSEFPSNFRSLRDVTIYGAANPVGQAKLLAQVLKESFAKGLKPEETLVVLPDEKLVLPVLHGIAGVVEHLNITMGFPLAGTPVFNLVELLIELQIDRRGMSFSHRQVTALLGHPYLVSADLKLAQEKNKKIKKENRVFVSAEWLEGNPLYALIFKTLDGSVLHYLKEIVLHLAGLEAIAEFDKEYLFYFLKLFNKMEEVTNLSVNGSEDESADARKENKAQLQSFLRLFRQLVRTQRIPFSGEPLRGLQVMGVLETRNLDFKNVFILSLNEGIFPSSGQGGSYVPYNIRKAYGLPTAEHQDAIFGYLFYRVMQRAEKVHLFHNSETDVLGLGEMSRYLRQLIYESGLPIRQVYLHNTVQPRAVDDITVPKDAAALKELSRFCDGPLRTHDLTPSAINDYIECSLRFYFRYVARIYEPYEVEEELDARVLGNLFHEVMERLYRHIMSVKNSKEIEATDFDGYEKIVDGLIDAAFRANYHLDEQQVIHYDGQRLVVKEVVKRFVEQIVKMDKAYAPFTIEALERKDLTVTFQLDGSGQRVVLGGRVDRADRKIGTDGEVLRVIDYKAGKDLPDIKGTIPDLFVRTPDRNKAAFQVLLYALLYRRHYKDPALKIVPGLINRLNLFDENFEFGIRIGHVPVDNVDPHLPEFEQGLRRVVEEIYDPAVPFEKTPNPLSCRICPYKEICYR